MRILKTYDFPFSRPRHEIRGSRKNKKGRDLTILYFDIEYGCPSYELEPLEINRKPDLRSVLIERFN